MRIAPLIPFNIASPQFKANPYPIYAQLRAEAPVARVTLLDKRVAWLVSRYDDVLAALRDERLVKDLRSAMPPDQLKKQPWLPGVFRPLERVMTHLDGGDHRRLRALASLHATRRTHARRAAEQRGALVMLVQASANRDERHFANPDMLDITRAPNKHLAFGWGAHYCVGAPLAASKGKSR